MQSGKSETMRTAVYVAPIPDQALITEVYPPQRNAEIAVAKNARVRTERFCAWKLLEFAVKDAFGKDLADLSPRKDQFGKWTCDGLFFSISHTAGAVAAAVSSAEIGVDIENIAAVRKRCTEERILHMYNKIGAEPPPEGDAHMLFLDAWTRREAAYKKSGKGAFSPCTEYAGEADAESGMLLTFAELYLALCGEYAGLADIYLCDQSGGKTLINDCFRERVR